MLARYLKAQFWVLLCGGATGPVLIALYFALPSLFGSEVSSYDTSMSSTVSSLTQQSIQWMLWVGLLITAGAVLVALWLANRGAKSSAKSAVLHQTGVLTMAQITALGETGMRINERPVVNLDLHIAGPGFAFDTQKRVTVDITKQAIVTARKLVVWVDPNTRDYEIDWQASGLICGVLPAQFNIAEDNQTYDLSGQAGPLMEILQIYRANNLPISGKVDIRSLPVVRQQVMAVVRRAAAQQPAAAGAGIGAAAAAPPQASVGQRLQDLEALHKSGAVSAEEYASKRAQIISEI
jgi:hypothetical protein